MAALSPEQVAAAAYVAGFRGPDLVSAVQVAFSESSWSPTAHNSCCYGLWQINLDVHTMSGQWQNPIDNAIAAKKIFDAAGNSWCNTGSPGRETCNPWQSYGNPRFNSVSSQAQMAVAQLNQDMAAGKTAEQIVGQGGTASPSLPGSNVNPANFSADISGVGKILGNIMNPAWLKRVGIGALGLVIVVVAIYFALPKSSGSFKAVKKVVNVG